MSWSPSFEIGICNGWLFMIIYPLQWLAVLVAPKQIAQKTGHASEILQSRQDKIMACLTQGLWILATLYSIFVPFRIGTLWFWAGLAFFVAGLAALVLATVAVAGTAVDMPFSSGIYRFSRHPMYLSMILVYVGISIAAVSWLFFLIAVITYFLQRYQMIQEEKYCLEKFGSIYRDYMNKTARWLGIPQKE